MEMTTYNISLKMQKQDFLLKDGLWTCMMAINGTVPAKVCICVSLVCFQCVCWCKRQQPSPTHPFVQAVCILSTVHQPLCERVAAGVTQRCMFTTL